MVPWVGTRACRLPATAQAKVLHLDYVGGSLVARDILNFFQDEEPLQGWQSHFRNLKSFSKGDGRL